MKRRIPIFLSCLLLFPCLSGHGQDSLAREHSLLKVADLIEAAQFDSAEWICKAVIAEAKAAGDLRQTLLGQGNLAMLFADIGQSEQAQILIEEAIQRGRQEKWLSSDVLISLYEAEGKVAYKRADFKRAKASLMAGLRLIRLQQDSASQDLANAYQNIAVVYGELGQYDSSMYYNRLALPIQERYKHDQPEMYAFLLANIGVDYGVLGDLSKATQYVEQAHEIRLGIYGPDHPDLGMSFHNLGYLSSRNGDYDRGLAYYDAAIRIYTQSLGAEHPNTLLAANMRGGILHQLERYTEAESVYEDLLDFFESSPQSSQQDLYLAYSRLGMSRYFLKKYASAERAILRSLEIVEAENGMDHPFRGEYLDKLSLIQAAQKRPAAAWDSGLEALRIYRLHYQPPHQDLVYTQFNQANRAVDLGWRDTALHYFALAEQAAEPPPGKAYLGRQISRELIRLYASKAQAFTGWASEATSSDSSQYWMLQAYEAVEAGRLALDTLRRQGLLRGSRLSLGAWSSKYLLQMGLDICLKLYHAEKDMRWLQRGLYFADQGKYGVMRDALRQAQIESSGGVPKAMLDSLHQIGQAISSDRLALKSLSETGPDFPLVQNRYLQKLRLQRQLWEEVDQSYPRFSALRYQGPSWDLSTIQASLPEETGLLYFSRGEDSLYTFLIQASRIRYRAIAYPSGLQAACSQVRSSLSGYFAGSPGEQAAYAVQADSFCLQAHRLYKLLIAPWQDDLSERVVIIPEGPMGYIPFAALLEQAPESPQAFHKHAYWGKSKALSYAFALGWWLRQANTLPGSNTQMLAMAPSFPQNRRDTSSAFLPPLQFNQQEARQVADIWPGELLLGKEATLDAFLEAAPRMGILHLATHASALAPGQGEAFCAFTSSDSLEPNNNLYLPDLYHLRLPAELVVLSACETGLGPLQAGEGIASLAGGFAQAGAARILMTLWPVQDQQTASLMPAFYTHLWDGKPADQALAAAQRAYLEGADAYLAHPFFWAGFSLYGRGTPLERPSPWGWWLGIGLAAILIAGGVWLFYHKRSK